MSDIKKLIYFTSALLLLIGLIACSPKTVEDQNTNTWQVTVNDFQVVDKLETTEIVTQYDGTKTEVLHQQDPTPGNSFLILNVLIEKINAEAVSFQWNNLVVLDSNSNEYHRCENDTFLELHNFTPRITGLDVLFGKNQGWLCYEVPTTISNGNLRLVYSSGDEYQEIALKK